MTATALDEIDRIAASSWKVGQRTSKRMVANGLVIGGKRSIGGVCFGKKFQKPKTSNTMLIEWAPMNISKNLAKTK